jgi:hypothetical protein
MGENKVSGFVLANPERMKKQEHKQAVSSPPPSSQPAALQIGTANVHPAQ